MAIAKTVVELLNAQTARRLALSDSGFVFDPVTGSSFTVNPSGLAILRQLQQETQIENIMSRLQADFEVDGTTIERDLIEFAGLLRMHFQ